MDGSTYSTGCVSSSGKATRIRGVGECSSTRNGSNWRAITRAHAAGSQTSSSAYKYLDARSVRRRTRDRVAKRRRDIIVRKSRTGATNNTTHTVIDRTGRLAGVYCKGGDICSVSGNRAHSRIA